MIKNYSNWPKSNFFEVWIQSFITASTSPSKILTRRNNIQEWTSICVAQGARNKWKLKVEGPKKSSNVSSTWVNLLKPKMLDFFQTSKIDLPKFCRPLSHKNAQFKFGGPNKVISCTRNQLSPRMIENFILCKKFSSCHIIFKNF